MIRRPPRSTLSLHDALPISGQLLAPPYDVVTGDERTELARQSEYQSMHVELPEAGDPAAGGRLDRKSTRLNSSHANISYAVFCLKKKNRSTALLSIAHTQVT